MIFDVQLFSGLQMGLADSLLTDYTCNFGRENRKYYILIICFKKLLDNY